MASNFTFVDDLEPLVLIGGLSAVAAATLTGVWLAVMALLPATPSESTADEELAFIAQHDAGQVARFLPTTLVAFAYVPTWLGLGVLLWNDTPAAAILAVSFGLLYPGVTATGYWMQYTVVRGLAQAAERDPAAARAAYEIVGFHDRPTSMAASAVSLGYTLWSFGGIAAGVGLVSHGGGLAVTTGILFIVTAGLMFVGVAGQIARYQVLALGVLLSGVVSLAATVATAILLLSEV